MELLLLVVFGVLFGLAMDSKGPDWDAMDRWMDEHGDGPEGPE